MCARPGSLFHTAGVFYVFRFQKGAWENIGNNPEIDGLFAQTRRGKGVSAAVQNLPDARAIATVLDYGTPGTPE
jgi:hypothetical protein